MSTRKNASAIDPFSQEFLRDPYPHHESLRQLAPVVWLERYEIFAMARHEQVHASLNNWETFCSSAGVGLSDFRKEKPWRPPSLLLEADPPLHTRTRGVVSRVLSRRVLNELRPVLEAEADRLVDRLLERGEFDAISDLAQAFPLKVFPDAVGIDEAGRENLLPYGNMVFNAFGPRNELFVESMRRAEPVIAWITSRCARGALKPGGFGAGIFAAAGDGVITEEEAGLLVRSLLTAGVDTTVNAIGNALACLVRFPDSLRTLRENPALARSAIDEVIRFESPVQTFFRTTTRAVEVADTAIPEGSKVLLFLGAANRDPLRWNNADTFDVRRNAGGHVGFGSGIHGCVGQMIARLEGEIVLATLARKVERIDPAGDAVLRLNNTLRGWERLPVSVKAKR